jgi:hypothetical protein
MTEARLLKVPQLYGVIRSSYLRCAVDTQVVKCNRTKCVYVNLYAIDRALCWRKSHAIDYLQLRLLLRGGSTPAPLRSKAWVWGRWHAGFAGSNPIEGVVACRFWVFRVRNSSLRTASLPSRGVLPSVCMCVCVCVFVCECVCVCVCLCLCVCHWVWSTPTTNRGTRKEVWERKKERKRGTQCMHGWYCDTATARSHSTEVCREGLLSFMAEIWRICKWTSTWKKSNSFQS